MLRRHPIAAALLALAVLAVAALAVFVLTFDLNRYRDQLQTTLSAALSQPVRLGEARLSLRHGPAIAFTDLRIGAGEGEAGVLRADRLFMRLELLPLLRGEVTFARVLVEAPRLTLILHPPAAEERKPFALLLDQGLLQSALVRSLAVRDGSLHLIDRRDPDRPFAASLVELEAEVSDLALDRPVRLQLAGSLAQEGTASPFSLSGEVLPNPATPGWEDLTVHLDLALERLDPAPLLQRYAPDGPRTSGRASVRLGLDGSAAAGLRFDGEVRGEGFALDFPALSSAPFPLTRASIAGSWVREGEAQHLRNLSLRLDDLSATGELSLLPRGEERWLAGSLAAAELPLPLLLHLLPDRKPPPALEWLQRRLEGGVLRVEAARFAGPLAQFRSLPTLPLQEADFAVADATLRLGAKAALSALAFTGELRQDRLALHDGRALLLDSPLRFSGAVTDPLQPARQLSLQAEGALPVEGLLPLLPPRPAKLSASGPLPLSLSLDGPAERLRAELKGDLQYVGLDLGQMLSKPAGLPGSLALVGEITPGRLTLRRGALQVSPLELKASGTLGFGRDRPFRLALEAVGLDLRRARFRAPLLERLQARGRLDLRYELDGAAGKIRQRQGSLMLHEAGLHLGGPVADLDRLSGTVRILADRVETDRLAGRLGTSPVVLRGSLNNFAEPSLELWVTGQAIRADDLIFPSEKLVFHDVDGHLLIDRNRLRLDPVKARLAASTEVVVRGAVENFRQPQVTLDIQATRADILDVIALWQRDGKREREAPREEGQTRVLITAQARQGTLGNLNFQGAEGEISYRGGVLDIHPLHFHAGKGYCVGRVVVEGGGAGPPLLKISGHLENFDAAALHHELLRKQGLVSGTLQGDFYLEGRAGKDFLPTSLGGFHLEVDNGILRKFRFLSKVFSLLNISQILTFQLPDMAVEGMPFNRLTGSVALHRGVLATEDLFVDSNAMNLSLVGEANLVQDRLDLLLGVKPLRTVDKIVTRIPVAGWLLAGEEKALVTAHFRIRGESADPEVTPVPITSVSEKALGIFKRVLGLPGKVLTEPGEVLGGQ